MSKSSKIDWEVLVYPYEEDSVASLVPSIGLPGVGSTSASAPKPANISLGVTSISFSRSKSNPSSSCQISYVGRPNPSMILGSWVVVRSYMKTTKAIVPRFVGQLSAASTDYITDGSGLKHRVTNYQIREWSSALTVPMRFDLSAISGATALAATLTSVDQMGALVSHYGLSDFLKDLEETRSAYSMARYILELAGAIVKENAFSAKPILGVTMPRVPEYVAKALGIDTSTLMPPYSAASSFSTGLMETVLGYMKHTASETPTVIYNRNGVLPPGKSNKQLYSEKTSSHPAVAGYGMRLSMGFSVWELLNSLCNPVMNEIFTDIVYKYKSDKTLIAQPTLFVRCRPFTLGKYKKESFSALTEKSFYDDLPVTLIDPEYIVSARVSYSLDGSPTYIRILPIEDGLNDPRFNAMSAQIFGTVALGPESRRFGGSEQGYQTSYVSQGTVTGTGLGFSVEDWLKGMSQLLSQWYGQNYRLPNMTLSMKDENIPFSVGSNVEFILGGWRLIGHVEAYSADVRVLPNGMKTSNSVLQLSRVMRVNDKVPDYLPEDALSYLMMR